MKGYCRALLNVVINPKATLIYGAKYLIYPKTDDLFFREWYDSARKRLRENPKLLYEKVEHEESKHLAEFVAHVDARLESFDFPVTTVKALGGDKVEAVKYLRAINRALEQTDVQKEKVLDRLTLLFYGANHALPYESIEFMLRMPNKSREAIFLLETQRLILKHALFEVMNQFGFEVELREKGFWTELQRIFYAALITPVKAFGYTDSSTGLAKLAYNPEFFADVMTVGYENALRGWRPYLEKKIGKAVTFENYIGISSAVFSTYFTLRLAYKMAHKKEEPLITPSPKPLKKTGKIIKKIDALPLPDLRRFLYDSWIRKQHDVLGFEPIDEKINHEVKKYFETMNPDIIPEE